MGKVLIINDADFSANSVETIFFEDFILKTSGFGALFLDYQNRTSILESKNSAVANEKLYVYKINPSLIGRTIQITTAGTLIDGAYYNAFSTNLGNLNFSDIPNLSGISLPSSSPVYYDINTIESFNVSSISNLKNTIIKTIPDGAKYLLLSAIFDEDLTPSDVKVELVN